MNYIGNKLVRELAYENDYKERYSAKAVLALPEEQGNGIYVLLKSYYSI